MKVVIGSDHAGFDLKEKIKVYLIKNGYDVLDKGAYEYKKTDDYPDYGAKVAKVISIDKDAKGILFCGSAEGICVVANKFRNTRAVSVWDKTSARMSREHNDANILCLAGGKTVKPIPALSFKKAKDIVEIWLNTNFSNVPRHKRRINKIKNIERKWKK